MFNWIKRYCFRVRELEAKVGRLEEDCFRLRTMLNDSRNGREDLVREIALRDNKIANQRAAINERDRKIEAIVKCLDLEDLIP